MASHDVNLDFELLKNHRGKILKYNQACEILINDTNSYVGGSDGLEICNEADNTNAATTTIIIVIIAIMITMMMMMIVFQQIIKFSRRRLLGNKDSL